MADTGYKDSLGNDLDTILEPIGPGTPGPDTGYKNAAGVDLAQLYFFGAEGGEPTAQPLGYYVGDGTTGTDIGTYFAEAGSPGTPSNPSPGLGWDFTDFSPIPSTNTFSVSTQETNPTGLFMSTDGNKAYMIGLSSDRVFEYDLATTWDISSAVYNNNSFLFSAQAGNMEALCFTSDGTTMYLGAYAASDAVYQYTLSTPWDITTASYANKSMDIASEEDIIGGMRLDPTGTTLIISGYLSKKLSQYTLSTPFDVSSGSYASKSYTAAEVTYLRGIEISPDGTRLFNSDAQTLGNIHEYSMSTPWDVTTSSYVGILNSHGDIDVDLFINSEGTYLFTITSQDNIKRYDLT